MLEKQMGKIVSQGSEPFKQLRNGAEPGNGRE